MAIDLKHAFIMNCHADVRQAIACARLLKKYWSEKSEFYLYFDGKEDEPRLLEEIASCATQMIRSPYEPEKSRSILNALNALMALSHEKGVEVASFLHADMIPIYPEIFWSFLEDFYRSGKIMTYCPIWPASRIADFCHLHFRVPLVIGRKMFPVTRIEGVEGEQNNYNEFLLSASLDRAHATWRDEAYPAWIISLPLYHNEAASPHGSFAFHNYIPKSSVIHVNDPWFWENYETLSVFEKRTYPEWLK